MISVLLPARGRPDHLRRSVKSLFDLAATPGDVEIVVRLDVDDPSLEAMRVVSGPWPTSRFKVIIGERWGYWPRDGKGGVHEYYNQCASIARGDLLLVWNDDTEMRTEGWDTLLCVAPEFSVQQLRRDTAKTADGSFPCISRAVYEAMGHVSRSVYVDMWVSHVGHEAGVALIRDDVVFCHHCLPGHDRGPREQQNASGVACETLYKSGEQVTQRAAAISTIKQAMAKRLVH